MFGLARDLMRCSFVFPQVFAYDHCFWSMDESVKEKYAGNVDRGFVLVVSEWSNEWSNDLIKGWYLPKGTDHDAWSAFHSSPACWQKENFNHSCFTSRKMIKPKGVGNGEIHHPDGLLRFMSLFKMFQEHHHPSNPFLFSIWGACNFMLCSADGRLAWR